MAVSIYWFSNAILNLLKAKGDLSAITIKVMLTTSSYAVNKNTHDFRDDVTNEVTCTGYVAGGKTLTTVTLAISSNVVTLDADDILWTVTGTLTARYAIIYASIGSAATDFLIGYVDFGGDVTAIDGTFKITWNTAGILKGTIS